MIHPRQKLLGLPVRVALYTLAVPQPIVSRTNIPVYVNGQYFITKNAALAQALHYSKD